MSTLRQFSEKDKNYFAYQARQRQYTVSWMLLSLENSRLWLNLMLLQQK
jgi:hypothetical protein